MLRSYFFVYRLHHHLCINMFKAEELVPVLFFFKLSYFTLVGHQGNKPFCIRKTKCYIAVIFLRSMGKVVG